MSKRKKNKKPIRGRLLVEKKEIMFEEQPLVEVDGEHIIGTNKYVQKKVLQTSVQSCLYNYGDGKSVVTSLVTRFGEEYFKIIVYNDTARLMLNIILIRVGNIFFGPFGVKTRTFTEIPVTQIGQSLGVWVNKSFMGIETLAPFGIVGPVNAIKVTRAGFNTPNEAMPNIAGPAFSFVQRNFGRRSVLIGRLKEN